MFSLLLIERYDEGDYLIGVDFNFYIEAFQYATFNPYMMTGKKSDWKELITAIKNNDNTIVNIRGVSDKYADKYVIAIINGLAIFSTNYDFDSTNGATNIRIPAIACLTAFERLLELTP